VAKVFEKIIYDQVYAYLMDNKTPAQGVRSVGKG
jgi:hypothetical protein